MSALLTGFILLFSASISQGTMGYGQKRFQPMSWEAYWFLFCILSMIAVPLIWINIVIPDPVAALQAVATKNMLIAATMGALWGIGALMWAKALVFLGLSITYGIGMSMSAMIGSLGVLFRGENIWVKTSTYWILTGIAVLILGILIITLAGAKREKIKGDLPDVSSLSKGMLVLMFVFAFANGIFSSGLPLGFDRVQVAADTAILQGAEPYNASLLNWVYVFIGGLAIQAGYAFVMMLKNKTFNSFTTPGVWKAYLTASITAVLWFAPLALFGMSTAVLGDLGKVIGWPIYCALAVIASNILAYFTGEWKGAMKPFWQMLLGVFVLIVSLVLFGYADTLAG
ncbi:MULTISPECIES: L-rhamnose/proton symporter RhaT [unclassified Saccharicrinis]|uniref:L-rhamnose/proton symporter RhaT n=1 Tax=unclassified Saccharicrinis TaxID=2646859 RepID=UPI003D34CF36